MGDFLHSVNVQGNRRCAALSRSVRLTAGLGIGGTVDRSWQSNGSNIEKGFIIINITADHLLAIR